MTILVWDSVTLAADKRSIQNGTHCSVTKIYKINGHLLGITGEFTAGKMVADWFSNGCQMDKWPECQKDKDRWATVVVISPEKKIFIYEQDPIPFEMEEEKFAFGSGRSFALAAMEMGADAVQSVIVASKYDIHCGNGVDTLTL